MATADLGLYLNTENDRKTEPHLRQPLQELDLPRTQLAPGRLRGHSPLGVQK